MKLARFAIPALAIALLGSTNLLSAQQYGPPQGPPPPGYGQSGPGGWDQPPGEFREFQRLGFHDGIEGARKDIENHRRPNVNNRDEFRHPNVPGNARRDYRDAFRRGYTMGIQHILGGGPGGPRPY
jgi:hypothetical protein